MKKPILIAAVACLAAGCKPSIYLEPASDHMMDVFSSVAVSYHADMGHNAIQELSTSCQFALDFQKQNDALEKKMAAIDDHCRILPNLERVEALGAAVAHLRQTAAWDTGARGPSLAHTRFSIDKSWPAEYHRLYRQMTGE